MMFRKTFLACLFAFCLLLMPHRAWAQGGASVVVYSVDFERFPTYSGLFDVYDAERNFISGLKAGSVSLLEDGQVVPLDHFEEMETPLYLVVAVNAGPALGVRDGQGFSRYDKAIERIKNWALTLPTDSRDDFSLAWNGGIVASHVSVTGLLSRFDSFDPQLRSSTPNLSALSYALDVAQGSNPPPGSKKAILLLSSHLDNQSAAGLGDLAARAQQAGVRVYVWVVDSNSFLVHPSSETLREFAAGTGGSSANFSGVETLPDLESWFTYLRSTYAFRYTSKIRVPGAHTLAVQVSSDGLNAISESLRFEVDIQAPKPILFSPPVQVVRQNEEDPFDLENSQPTEQEIQVMIEFPDGYTRPLTRAALYVDGELAQEKTSPPFDRFTWSLREYTVTDTHLVSVEVEDGFGFKQTSQAVPITVTVIQPPGGLAGWMMQNQGALAIAGIVLSGAVLVGIILFGGRWSLERLEERRKTRLRNLDPVTQPVEAHLEPPSRPAQAPFPWMRRKAAPPQAYLVKLTSDHQPASGDPISLSAAELTLGTDPTQATHVLGDVSVSPLHARLRRDENGNFVLSDQNSVAGTWVNYQPLTKEGHLLRHGDVVNFGMLTYRFVSGKPPAAVKPKITPIKDE